MKITELFRKKLDMLFSKTDPAEQEFMEVMIYNNIDASQGLTIKQLKVIIPEIIGFNIRIVGIETVNKRDVFDVYNWEKYKKSYSSDWLLEAVREIQEKRDSPRCFLYVNFPEEVLRRFKEVN